MLITIHCVCRLNRYIALPFKQSLEAALYDHGSVGRQVQLFKAVLDFVLGFRL